jgi:hypothetical protein
VEDFQDVRELQRTLKARGITMTTEVDESTEEPSVFHGQRSRWQHTPVRSARAQPEALDEGAAMRGQ